MKRDPNVVTRWDRLQCRVFGHYQHPLWDQLCGRCGEVGWQWCPRRQCRGRVPHSGLTHWLGWIRR